LSQHSRKSGSMENQLVTIRRRTRRARRCSRNSCSLCNHIPLRAWLLASLSFATACIAKPAQEARTEASREKILKIVFAYGSEKERWIADVTDSFNRAGQHTNDGKRIIVNAIPMGSGEAIDETLDGRRQPDLISPASAAFVRLGNAKSQNKYGRPLIGDTQSLVHSPVVIAMWKPMAESIGWGEKALGWSDVLMLAETAKGWKAYGHPEWGTFKFGYTRPPFSTSGLNAIFEEVYAASGKTDNLTVRDVRSARTARFMFGIEKSIVYYGSSTGFYGRLMFLSGPQYLSAAVLYENLVIESYSEARLPFPVVAIYPKEGTLWSDHPIGIVNRDWVTSEHREAAKIYIRYLLERPQQQRAITYGFRPGAPDIPLASPIDKAHGVDPTQPTKALEVPSVAVIDSILRRWQNDRRAAQAQSERSSKVDPDKSSGVFGN
jgi:Ca-activated chloride channel homolog